MRYPPEETAEKHRRILKEAARLFRERGFSGVSVAEIMKATGLTHGPFYNHFDSKEALMREALATASTAGLEELDRVTSQQGLGTYLDIYLSRAHAGRVGEGCPIAALGTDVGKEPAAQPALTAHVVATLARLESLLPGRQAGAARAEAMRTLSSMVGALVLARAVDDQALGDDILAAVREGLDA